MSAWRNGVRTDWRSALAGLAAGLSLGAFAIWGCSNAQPRPANEDARQEMYRIFQRDFPEDAARLQEFALAVQSGDLKREQAVDDFTAEFRRRNFRHLLASSDETLRSLMRMDRETAHDFALMDDRSCTQDLMREVSTTVPDPHLFIIQALSEGKRAPVHRSRPSDEDVAALLSKVDLQHRQTIRDFERTLATPARDNPRFCLPVAIWLSALLELPPDVAARIYTHSKIHDFQLSTTSN